MYIYIYIKWGFCLGLCDAQGRVLARPMELARFRDRHSGICQLPAWASESYCAAHVAFVETVANHQITKGHENGMRESA